MFLMKENLFSTKLWLVLILSIAFNVQGHPICIDSTFPFVRNGASFSKCSQYNGAPTCISPEQESNRVKEPQYPNQGANVPATCRQYLRNIACTVADQWSGHLFRAEGPGESLPVPKLCPQYCEALYDECSTVQMSHSPFVKGSTSTTTIAAKFASKSQFCEEFAEELYCFSGQPYTVPPPQAFNPSLDLCTERVISGGEPKVNMVPVPGYSDLMAIGDLEGRVRIYVVNNAASGQAFTVHSQLLDIRSRVRYGGEQGLLGLAMHKNFFDNGRFYVSFTCEAAGNTNCQNGDSIVEEYRVLNPKDRSALQAAPSTRRRIIRVDQPFSNHNGGQVIFSPNPNDPHMYFMLGDGGSGGDPGNRAQPLTTLLGKVLRINVDANFANGGPGVAASDNPFVNVNGAQKMIWANGLRNPWRCSFDRETFIMYCGDVGQNAVEEVDIITKGGNYGWRKFEGNRPYESSTKLQGNRIHIPPILSYTHQSMGGFASVTGGYVIRSSRDTRIRGDYIFGDLSGPYFIAREDPVGSGQWSMVRVGTKCAPSSPVACSSLDGPYSFGEMQSGDILVADGSGSVFRIIEPEKCSLTRAPTKTPTTRSPTKAPTTASPTPPTPAPTRACRALGVKACRRRKDCRVNRRKKCVPR